MKHGIYNKYDDSWLVEERRKRRDRNLAAFVTAYAFQKLAEGNTEKAQRATALAIKLESQLED
jgi:hypothetical protein